MSENIENENGAQSGANGQDSEIYTRAKKAEAELKAEREARAKLEKELEDARKGGNTTDTETLKTRIDSIEKSSQEIVMTQKTNDLSRMLNVDEATAKEILTIAGGDLNKASEMAKDENTLVGKAVKQAQHQASLRKNVPSAQSGFGGTYKSKEGKAVSFDELPDHTKQSAYANEVSDFQRKNPLNPQY